MMAIKETMALHTFIKRFKEIRPDNFSDEGLVGLFNQFNDLSEETGEDLEFDPIAICVDFIEYDSFKELQEDYDQIESLEDLWKHTNLIQLRNGGLIIQAF
jgi:hypothetical protein